MPASVAVSCIVLIDWILPIDLASDCRVRTLARLLRASAVSAEARLLVIGHSDHLSYAGRRLKRELVRIVRTPDGADHSGT